MPGFSLNLPDHVGLTHVIDKGLGPRAWEDVLDTSGDYIDIVKLGWGTALATENLTPKLERYRAHGIPVVLGGTLTELAIQQDKVDDLAGWLEELGIEHVEVSDGTITLAHERKLELITTLSDRFTVLSEVGSKDATHVMAPYRWVEDIQAELDAGAWKVICEARESGTAGIARPDGELREGLIDEIAHDVDATRIVFEAPQKDQQVHLLRRFGPDVNLGNIAPVDVLSLETMRLGLRSDTMDATP